MFQVVNVINVSFSMLFCYSEERAEIETVYEIIFEDCF
jgi:hypothetical protein